MIFQTRISKISTLILFSSGAILAHISLAAQEALPTVDSLLKKANISSQNHQEESIYNMRLIGRDGSESVRKMQVWYKGGEEGSGKLLIKFLDPANIRGTGFLNIVEKGKEAEQWLYLPALKRARRIIGGNSSESFLGSDFSMSDVSVEANKLYDFKVKSAIKCAHDVEKGDCYLLEGFPKAGKESDAGYSKKVIYVRKDSSIPISSEFYGASGQLEKVMTLNGLRKVKEGEWTAKSIEMKNVQSGHRTVIEYEKRDVTKVPSDSLFSKSNLERER